MYKLQVTRKSGEVLYIKIEDNDWTCWIIDPKGTALPEVAVIKLKKIVDSSNGFKFAKNTSRKDDLSWYFYL